MPLCTRPGQTFAFVFASDEALKDPPRVICKALPRAEAIAIEDKLQAVTTMAEADALVAPLVVGVENMGEIKDATALLAKLTFEEVAELTRGILRGRVSEGFRKNF